MDVVVCGAQVPFVRGGVELLMENLVRAFRRRGHRADLVRLPVAWEKGRLFDSPMAWRLTPIDADLVVATNFPSYFVRHPNKVVWLAHQHRGAYDLAAAEWSDIGHDDVSLEAQRLLAAWDAAALSEASRVFTISRVVTDRLLRFNGITSTPLYHPPPLDEVLRPGNYGDYVLCPSRLAANKRPQLVVEALAHLATPSRAVVAGEGPLRAELEKTASELGVADILGLTGFVPDEQLVALFADARAVVYPPLDEDYGYVTLQAFLAEKPVITCQDSGGVLEWVEDGVNGIVTDGSPKALAAAIDRLAVDESLARDMGTAGRAKVAELSWDPVVAALAGA